LYADFETLMNRGLLDPLCVPLAAVLVQDEFGHVALVIGDESELCSDDLVKIVSFTFGENLKI
jgi:hypothetical protein